MRICARSCASACRDQPDNRDWYSALGSIIPFQITVAGWSGPVIHWQYREKRGEAEIFLNEKVVGR
jgi:hypothetical protein